jgi:beta-phosphoglucomutase-like phosphatase (HAD superfamily)
MVQALIFDIDGTLVQTERLKAHSYACAAVELCPRTITEAEVIEAFKEVVGLTRREVATALMERFGLEDAARTRMDEFGVRRPWQALVQVRLQYYEAMLDDPDVLRRNQWLHNLALLDKAQQMGCQTALATMSGCQRTRYVLDALGLTDAFGFVATVDDVENGKPDPEIYRLVLSELAISPEQGLVIEDSPSGVKAALAAGVHVVAVSTPFTRDHLHESGLLPPEHIVDDPNTLPDVVSHIMRRQM